MEKDDFFQIQHLRMTSQRGVLRVSKSVKELTKLTKLQSPQVLTTLASVKQTFKGLSCKQFFGHYFRLISVSFYFMKGVLNLLIHSETRFIWNHHIKYIFVVLVCPLQS